MLNGFGAGRTVYSGGSFAPNRGQVSATGAQGYVRRSLAQGVKQNNFNGRFNGAEGQRVGAMRIGNDGRSDTRSGLAGAALNRMKAMGSMGGGGHGGILGHPGGNTPPMTPGGKPLPGPRAPHEPGPGGGSGGGTPVPQVQINAQGQLELPYDAGYNQQVYGDLADFNNQLMQLQIGSQQQQAQYAQQMRNENLGFQGQQRSDLANNAASGTAFSSRYATDVGNTYGAHQNNLTDLQTGNTQYNQQVSAQKAAIQDQFNQELQQAAADRANRAAQNAGHLGYGDKHGNGGSGGKQSDRHNAGNGKHKAQQKARDDHKAKMNQISDILKHGKVRPKNHPGPTPPRVRANR